MEEEDEQSVAITLPHPLPQDVVQTLLQPDSAAQTYESLAPFGEPLPPGDVQTFADCAACQSAMSHEEDTRKLAACEASHAWQNAELESCRARCHLLEAALESERSRYDTDMQCRIDSVYGHAAQEAMAAVAGSMLARS